MRCQHVPVVNAGIVVCTVLVEAVSVGDEDGIGEGMCSSIIKLPVW